VPDADERCSWRRAAKAIDASVGRWSMEHGQMAGHGTDTLAAAPRFMCR
jgi:two-component system sensor histidine kinase KdpD